MNSSIIPIPKENRLKWTLLFIGILAIIAISLYPQRSVGMTVTFHNSSQQMIQSIKLDFGSADTQSTIRALRIPPGKERILLLNHQPGMGFNVQVNYKDGRQQSFCALRGDKERDPVIHLQI